MLEYIYIYIEREREKLTNVIRTLILRKKNYVKRKKKVIFFCLTAYIYNNVLKILKYILNNRKGRVFRFRELKFDGMSQSNCDDILIHLIIN